MAAPPASLFSLCRSSFSLVIGLFLVQVGSALAQELPNRVCHRLHSVKDLARAKYLLCFHQGTLSELDFTGSPVAGEKFGKIPLKVKLCHGTQAPLERSYAEVKKLAKDGKFQLELKKISARFTEEDARHDDFYFRQDNASILDGTSGVDSLGTGWCFWREKPLREQAKDENCVNALACSELWPEYCDCRW